MHVDIKIYMHFYIFAESDDPVQTQRQELPASMAGTVRLTGEFVRLE